MKNAYDASELLKAIANPHRLALLCQMLDGEKSVGQLADQIGLRDSTTSQNLALLRKTGVVAARRDGQTMWYSICHEGARLVLDALYQTYCSTKPVCASAASKSLRGKTK